MSLQFLNLGQDVSVDTLKIEARHDALNSFLFIPVNFTFRRHDHCCLSCLEGIAKLKTPDGIVLGEEKFYPGIVLNTVNFYGQKKDLEEKTRVLLDFNLSEKALFILEKERQSTTDLKLTLNIELHGLINTLSGQPVQFDRSNEDVYFSISQSEWINKLLPKLGVDTLRLFEIPVRHKSLPEAYGGIVKEFTEAEKYFIQKDYPKCIAHCRNTMDKLKENLIHFREKKTSKTGFEWMESIDEATMAWIDAMNKRTSKISSKTHHSGLQDFDRFEAESVFLVVMGIMNYIGNLE